MDKQDLIGKKVSVLDKGWVQLIDVMGSDSDICDAARVSYGKGTKTVSDDETLIRYMMRHGHTSPFEQAEVKFRIHIPMDAWRQGVRHRTASINEVSTRYSEACDDMQETSPGEWRLQSKDNKQGSGGSVTEWPEDMEGMFNFTPGHRLSAREKALHNYAKEVYWERLKLGVAREQARKDLPLSQYTTLIWKCDLHNTFGFVYKRWTAQYEISQYAKTIYIDYLRHLFPLSCKAFDDYVLSSIKLSALDIECMQSVAIATNPNISALVGSMTFQEMWCVVEETAALYFHNKRERNEFLHKYARVSGFYMTKQYREEISARLGL